MVVISYDFSFSDSSSHSLSFFYQPIQFLSVKQLLPVHAPSLSPFVTRVEKTKVGNHDKLPVVLVGGLSLARLLKKRREGGGGTKERKKKQKGNKYISNA